MLKGLLDDILSDVRDRIRLLIDREREEAVEAEKVLTDDLAVAATAVEKEWKVRGDNGCSMDEQDALRAALTRYREARKS